jgi:hypothetical protein
MVLTGIPQIPAGASHICPDRGVLGKERRCGFARQTLQIIASSIRVEPLFDAFEAPFNAIYARL